MKQGNFLSAALMSLMTLVPGLAGSEQTPADPPDYVGPAVGERAVTNRAVTMVSSLAIAPEGRLWVTWYAGPTPAEDVNNYVVLATSGDDGETLTETLVIDPDGPGPIRAFDPQIWLDPEGRLWLFWAQAREKSIDAWTWAMVADDPGAENPQWSEPRKLAPGVMMCKPIVLRDGTWAFPICDWEGRRSGNPEVATAQLWISTDRGERFTLRGGAVVPLEDRSFDEHMLIEREDGSLWMLVRTRYGIGESVSTDGGRTWSEVAPSSIPHPSARFFINRLQSGNLLLVKHGPMDKQTGRSQLMAFVSSDDGDSWEGGLLLDERNRLSYPDGQQSEDGTIYITYDFERTGAQNILFAAFREEDALAGEAVTDSVRLRQLVSQGSFQVQRANDDGEPLRDDLHGALTVEGFQAESLENEAQLFADRNRPSYFAKNIPTALSGARFLPLPMNGNKTVRVTRSGTVFFLTPRPERNRDSQSQSLIEQGFRLVALPEFPLKQAGGGDHRNLVSLYQKDVTSGETITIGKWAVPVFFP